MRTVISIQLFFSFLVVLVNVRSLPAAPPETTLTNAQKQQLEEAKKLYLRADELQKEGKAKDAFEAGQKSLSITKAVLGEDHEETAAALGRVGLLMVASDDYAGAMPYYERIFKIRKKLYGDENLETAAALNDLGIVAKKINDVDNAKNYFERSLKTRQKLLGNDHEDVAFSLENLGGLLVDQAEYEAARPLYEQALEIRKKVLGEEHADTLAAMNNLGFLLKTQGDYVAAGPYYERALSIFRKVLGNEHPSTATSLNNLGGLREAQGELVAARSYYDEALAIQEKVLGEDDLRIATTLNNIGYLMYELGDYTTAKSYHEKSLKIRRKVGGDANPDIAMSLNNLALIYVARGDYVAARSNFEQALEICKKSLGDEHPYTATSLDNLGNILSSQGDFAGALSCGEQALQIRKKVLGEDHPETATSLSNLGLLLTSQKKYAEARPYFDQALAICRKVLGEDHPQTTTTLNNLGNLLQSQKDYVTARKFYEAGLKNTIKSLGAEHPDTGNCLNNLGGLARDLGDSATAKKYCEQSLQIWKKVLGNEHPNTVVAMNNLATLEAANDQWDVAAKLTDDARRGIRSHIAHVLPTLTQEKQIAFLEETDVGNFHSALTLGLLRRADSKLSALSAGWLINGKSVAQSALAERTLMARDVQNPKLAGSVQELLEVRRKLAELALGAAETGQDAARRDMIARLTTEEDRLARRLNEATGGKAKTDLWVELADVQRGLPKDGALIDIARFEVFNFKAKGSDESFQPARYAAWITRPVGDVQIVDLGLAEPIDAAVANVKKAIEAVTARDSLLRKRGERIAVQLARQDLKAATDLVWKPISTKLGNAKSLFLSPDAALWLLPWGALTVGEDKFLIEDFSITYLSSGRDLVSKPIVKIKNAAPVLVANPDFDLSSDQVQAAVKTLLPNVKFDDDDQTRAVSMRNSLPNVLRLPGTAGEADAIKPSILRYSGMEPQLHEDAFALESVFKRVQRPKLVVLSTHGFFLPDQIVKPEHSAIASDVSTVPLTTDGKPIENPLLRCGLLFAGCNARRTNTGDDGILTGMEIVGIDLRGTELVVLSACETGIGQVQSGEGVAGLRQAFQLAGAESVVATLWQIPDIESARMMNDFFVNLANGQNKADSLRDAQLKRIAARREKYGAAHPFFWAAFTLTGR